MSINQRYRRNSESNIFNDRFWGDKNIYLLRRFLEFGRRVNLGVVRKWRLAGVVSGIGCSVWGILVGKLANLGLELGCLAVSALSSSFGLVLFRDSFISMESFNDPSSSTSILWLSAGNIVDGVSWIGVGVGGGMAEPSPMSFKESFKFVWRRIFCMQTVI